MTVPRPYFTRKPAMECIVNVDSLPFDGAPTVEFKTLVYPERNQYVYPFIDAEDLSLVAQYDVFALTLKGDHLRILVDDQEFRTLGHLILGSATSNTIIRYRNSDRLDHRRNNLLLVKKIPMATENLNRNYIASPIWKVVRVLAMQRARGICEKCRINLAIDVHHILPANFFVNSEDAHRLDNALAVCKKCHKKEHILISDNLPLFSVVFNKWTQRKIKRLYLL